MNILLLGGTKDSTNIIRFIKDNYNVYILTTTTTEYGARLASESGSDDTIARPLPKDNLIEVIKEHDIDIIIDATHPFAEHITKTIVEISKELKMPFIRFERPTTNLESVDTTNIHYVKSFDEAGKLIANEFNHGNVLHFAGANTMESILKYIPAEKFYPRILKVASSLEKCEKLGISEDHLIAMTGAASVEENIELIEKYCACVMITKESGEIGGVIEKIEASNRKNIAVIMIQRPEIKELDKNNIVSDLDELDKKLKHIIEIFAF